jgi:hypothetical protein
MIIALSAIAVSLFFCAINLGQIADHMRQIREKCTDQSHLRHEAISHALCRIYGAIDQLREEL